VASEKIATVDLDATIIESWKREAKATYEGGTGYQPVLALWAEMNVVVAGQFRDGNVPAHQALWLAVRRFAPQLEWSFMRSNPAFWAVVMVAYPVLSVYPQGCSTAPSSLSAMRGFFPGKWAMIVASAAAFAFLHTIFRNPLAVALTFADGLLFAVRYAETGSLATSCFEHALYGCWLFTVGLGQCFYHGTIATMGSVMRR
jgi:hypothetical protein